MELFSLIKAIKTTIMKKALLFYLISCVIILSGAIATAQNTISDLTLDISSADNTTNDDLYVFFTEGADVVETAKAWYINASPIATLLLPFEIDSLSDFSGSGNHASASGNPDSEPDWTTALGHNGGGAMLFDGNDYLAVSSALPLNSSYTKTAWINISLAASGYRNIISSTLDVDSNHCFKVDPDGSLNAGHSYGTVVVVDDDSLFHEQWYFVAVTFDYPTGEMILFKDGNEVGRDTVPEGNRSVVDGSVLIGTKDYSYYWQGYIDDPTIYNFAMSPEQIDAVYTDASQWIIASSTHGSDQWYADVTPFSATAVGSTSTSNTITLQPPPGITDLLLDASSPENLPEDDLLSTYTRNLSVVETASAWYRNSSPITSLHLHF